VSHHRDRDTNSQAWMDAATLDEIRHIVGRWVAAHPDEDAQAACMAEIADLVGVAS